MTEAIRLLLADVNTLGARRVRRVLSVATRGQFQPIRNRRKGHAHRQGVPRRGRRPGGIAAGEAAKLVGMSNEAQAGV